MKLDVQEERVLRPIDYLLILKRWWWVVALVPLLASGSAYWFSSNQEPSYVASATLFVSQASSSPGDVSAARLLAQTYGELVISRPVIEYAITNQGISQSVSDIMAKIRTTVVRDTQIIKISTVDSDPQTAAVITNAVAESFAVWIAEEQRKTLGQSADALEQSIKQTEADIEKVSLDLATLRSKTDSLSAENEVEIVTLETLLRQYQSKYSGLLALQQRTELTPQSRVIVSSVAESPGAPDSPRPWQDSILALGLSLGLAITGIILFERTTDRIRLPADVYRNAKQSVLGQIPRGRRGVGIEILTAPQSVLSESIRSLRAMLHFATDSRSIGAVVITSPGPNEGKSIVAANLAVAIAQLGQRVVLVDGDLRHPYQHNLFAIANQGGLSHLLVNAVEQPVLGNGSTIEGNRVVVRNRKDAVVNMLVDGPVPGLKILAAGAEPHNPLALLTSKHLKRIITELKHVADVIIIDAAPVFALSDALFLTAASDHAIIVAESGQTSAEALRATITSVAQTKVHMLGVVLYGGSNSPSYAHLPYVIESGDGRSPRYHNGQQVVDQAGG